jgi:nucleoside-diphosphate-sugar epimerase
MHIFLTGGTGYLGSAIGRQLLKHGHTVSALARSDRSAAALAAAGMAPIMGDLADLAALRAAANTAEGVIHAGFSHDDWGRMDEAFVQDENAVDAMLDALARTEKPFIYSSGSGVLADTGLQEAAEDAPLSRDPSVARRIATEKRVLNAPGHGVVIRPGLVFGHGGGGVVHMLIDLARRAGVGRMVDEGTNAWSAVHLDDVALAYALAIEKAGRGELFHLAAGAPVEMRALASAIGKALGQTGAVEPWPIAEARMQIGMLADGLASNKRVSAAKAMRVLGWKSTGPSLVDDIMNGSYQTVLTGAAQ